LHFFFFFNGKFNQAKDVLKVPKKSVNAPETLTSLLQQSSVNQEDNEIICQNNPMKMELYISIRI